MLPLAAWQWALGALAGVLVGVSKTGVPGLGTLVVPLFALILPARASTGALLPLLVLGDLFAVGYYRRHAVWVQLLRLLPLSAAGVILGFLAMRRVSDRELRPLLGVLVLAMQAVSLWRSWRARGDPPALDSWWFAALMGILAGVTTMLANAAGPIMLLYLLALRLPKAEFLGTGAWFFLVINLFKVPFSAALGLITPQSLLVDLSLAPAVIGGAFLGVLLVRRIPERAFTIVVQVLTAAAAVILFF